MIRLSGILLIVFCLNFSLNAQSENESNLNPQKNQKVESSTSQNSKASNSGKTNPSSNIVSNSNPQSTKKKERLNQKQSTPDKSEKHDVKSKNGIANSTNVVNKGSNSDSAENLDDINSRTDEENTGVSHDYSEPKTVIVENNASAFHFNSFEFFLLLLVIILQVLAIVYLWIERTNSIKRYKELFELKGLKEQELNKQIQLTQSLESRICNLSRELSDLKATSSTSILTNISKNEEVNVVNTVGVVDKKAVFVPYPVNGNFTSNQFKDSVELGNTFFQLILSENSGLFYFIPNNLSAENIYSMQSYFMDACDFSNSFQTNSTRVEVVGNSTGRVVLDGQNWRIKEKIKLKYV